jgi:hypothetical protein
MKFHIDIAAPADRGRDIDAAGGPGPIVAELMQRFQPEVMYGSADRRTLTFVADVATDVDVAVLMEICSDRLYAYPTLRPVVAIADFHAFVTTVHERVGQPLAAS